MYEKVVTCDPASDLVGLRLKIQMLVVVDSFER